MFETVLYEVGGDSYSIFIALLKAMKRRYHSRIVLVCRTKEEQLHFEAFDWIDVVIPATRMPRQHQTMTEPELMRRAGDIERRTGIRAHYTLIEHRLFYTGAPNFPRTRVRRTYPEWIAHILDEVAFYENLIREQQVSCVLHGKAAAACAAMKQGVQTWRLEACLYEYRYMWTPKYRPDFPEIAEAYRDSSQADDAEIDALEQSLAPPSRYYDIRESVAKQSRFSVALREAAIQVLRGVYYRLKGYDKAIVQGYSGIAWAKYLLRQNREFKRLGRLPLKRLEEFKDKPYVFMALSAEPELTLSFWTPEFFDQLSTVQQLAKELPVGSYLVVKEHMIAIGNRPSEFYETIARMPNVILCDPMERGLDVGREAVAVAAIASTAATEALLRGIPVLYFGQRCWFEFMPHVHVIRAIKDVRAALVAALSADSAQRYCFARAGATLKTVLDAVTLDPMSRNADGEAVLGDYLLDSLLRSQAKRRPAEA